MNIVVIYGSPREKRSNSHTIAQFVLAEMRKHGEVETTEFFMPRDLPEFCTGCTACVLHGEHACPHAAYTLPILDAMLAADALIISSPVFVLAETAALKNFLDHFCYLFIVHRARPEMFRKKALILCSTAGGGAGNAIATARRALTCWGINHIQTLGLALYETEWRRAKPQRQAKFERKLQKTASSFHAEVAGGKRHFPAPFFLLLYAFMRWVLLPTYAEDSLDKQYWQQHGWLRKTPF